MENQKVHIAMVGSTIENIIAGINAMGATDLYPIISENFWPEAYDELKSRLSSIVELHDQLKGKKFIIDPFKDDSFIKMLDMIIDIVEFHPNKDAEFWINITGGTNLMSAAAEAGAVLTRSTAYYVVEGKENNEKKKRGSVIVLPWHSVNPLGLDNKRKQILSALDDNNNGLSNKGIIEINKNDFTSRSIVHYLKELEKADYIASIRDGRNKINRITTWGKIALRIVRL